MHPLWQFGRVRLPEAEEASESEDVVNVYGFLVTPSDERVIYDRVSVEFEFADLKFQARMVLGSSMQTAITLKTLRVRTDVSSLVDRVCDRLMLRWKRLKLVRRKSPGWERLRARYPR